MASSPVAVAHDRWGESLADRAAHGLDCTACTWPFLDSAAPIVLCTEGQRLADAEGANYKAWSQLRMAGAV